MKTKLAFSIASILLVMCFCGCSLDVRSNDNTTRLTIFAAASLTETLSDIGDIYTKSNPDVELVYNFDSSGTLKTQIEEGARCDLFISASSTQMNELDAILEDSRIDLLENKVALVVPNGNPKNIQSFDNMVSALDSSDILMAIGNADVPVGEYTLKIFDFYGLNVRELNSSGSLTYGSNVKEVTTQVLEGMVDCGIVYQTDACSANLQVVDTATAQMCGQVIYPAAILKTSDNIEHANAFLDFLSSDVASSVFEKVGFTPLT